MAKAILSSILEAQLGKYVDGLSSDSLQVGLWSGEMVLQNLSLKPHALAELELPVTVVRGSIARIHVVVPWNQLGSASVQITIEGIYALVVPNTKLPSPEERKQSKQNRLERQELMRQHQRFADKTNRDSGGEDESTFLSRLTMRIVDNMQVTLRDLHIRYEDSLSNSANPFACGVMMQSFTFHTTDAEGNAVFMDRTAKKEAFIFKAAKVTKLCAYWDRLPKDVATALIQNQPDINQAMGEMVRTLNDFSEEGKDKGECRDQKRLWVLRPCSLAVQMTKNESMDYSIVAKYTIQAKISSIACGLSREQYKDMLFLNKAFAGRRAIEAHFFSGRCRPFHDATARPRVWWDYATRLLFLTGKVKAKERGRKKDWLRLRWSNVQKAALERNQYMEAFRLSLRQGSSFDHASKHGKFMKQYETIYPIDVIIAIRDFSEDKEIKQKKLEDSKAAAAQAASGSSWYSYLFGGGSSTTTSNTADDVLTEEGKASLKKAYDDVVVKEKADAVPAGCNLFSIKLQLKSGSLALHQTHQLQPFLIASVNGSLAVNIQPQEEWDVKFRLQHFEILNGKAKDTPFHAFCVISSAAKLASPTLPCVTFDASIKKKQVTETIGKAHGGSGEHETLTIRVSAMPIRLMVDPSFVVFLHGFFMSMMPEQQLDRVWNFATSSVSDWMFAEDDDEVYKNAIQSHIRKLQYDVLVDVSAPVIVLPENIAEPRGAVVVVDLGQLCFRNDSTTSNRTAMDAGPDRLYWRLEMKDIQVLLGAQESLDWNDAGLSGLAEIVQKLSLDFFIDSIRTSSGIGTAKIRENIDSTGAPSTPNIEVRAVVPQISITLAEDQLITLGRIHSSIFATTKLMAAGAGSSEELFIASADKTSPSAVVVVSSSKGSSALESTGVKPEKYFLMVQLSLGELVLNIRESAIKDAFLIRISHTSFKGSMFSSQYIFQARLQTLQMEDKLYGPSLKFYQLVSTGSSDDTHLVSVDMTVYPESARVHSLTLEREATNMVVDANFNVLDVQWNPSSIALLYRILSSYAGALQHYTVDTHPDTAADINTAVVLTNQQDGRIEPKELVEAENSKTLSLPSVLVRASLVQFSVTFNKDQLNRQLVQVAMRNASVEYAAHEKRDLKTGEWVSAYEITGCLGNLIATDLSISKHAIYAPLMGLDELTASSDNPALRHRSSSTIQEPLLSFTYSWDPIICEKSKLKLDFQPVRVVYYHQQVLELVDYLFEGILGAILSQTILNATQLLLSEEESSVIFQIAVRSPTLILPLRMEEASHIKITAEALQLVHFPSSVVQYCGTGRLEDRTKKITYDGESVGQNALSDSNCLIIKADYKQVTLKNVDIFCTTESSKLSGLVAKETAAAMNATYQSVLANPIDLVVNVEDIVSSTLQLDNLTYLPRFTIEFVMQSVQLRILRAHYLAFVALVFENFGAEELSTMESSNLDTATGVHSSNAPSLRPTVNYSYSRTDLDAVTMQLTFAMKDLCCQLYEEKNASVQSLPSTASEETERIVNQAFGDVGRSSRSAFIEIKTSGFSASLNRMYKSSPNVAVRVAAFSVRDIAGNYNIGEDGSEAVKQAGALLVCRQPAEAVYSWDEAIFHCQLDLNVSDVSGLVIPETLLRLIDFVMLPTKPKTSNNGPNSPTLPIPDASNSDSTSTSMKPQMKRRQSISEMLMEAHGPEYAMTIKLLATNVAIAVPQDIYDLLGPQLSCGADFTVEYTWKPEDQSMRAGGTQSSGLDVQSSLVVDAQSIEVVVKNANRQGCCVATSSANTENKGVKPATMLQILEPCDLRVEISDLFPDAGQQQQIVVLKFTPIDVFVSYDDVCVAWATLESFNNNFAHYEAMQKREKTELATVSKSNTAGVLSPKMFEHSLTGTKEGIEVHRYFTCDVSSMRVTIINDCDGCDMGLAQLHMQRCNFFMNITHAPVPAHGTPFPPPATTISGGGGFATIMSYYNPDTRNWHPMNAEWNLDLSVQGSIYNDVISPRQGRTESSAGGNELHIMLTANQPLDLLFTHGLFEVAASAGGAWKRRANGPIVDSPIQSPINNTTARENQEVNEKKKHAPCVISNETGLDLSFWLTNGQSNSHPQILRHSDIADLHYIHTVGRGSGVVRKYASEDREGNMRLCIQLADSSFQAVQGIIFEQLGSRAFPLVDVSGSLTSFTLNCYSKLVDGRILLSFSSQIKLVNKLSMPIQLLVNDPTWTTPVEIGVLQPFRESAIPVLLSQGTELRARPTNTSFSWSAPIPVQTRSETELKVEASSNGVTDVRCAMFCVAISMEQSLRVVSFSEPIVLVNKLPVEVEYCIKDSSMGGSRYTAEGGRGGRLSVGGKAGIWWSDLQQRPQFTLTVEGCMVSKWMQLVHPNSKSGELFAVMVERYDGRPCKLLVQVIEHAAKSMHVYLYAEIWFINRTGLELIYGNESDSEAYMPPYAARALVGNAQISAYSSSGDSNGGLASSPTVRIRMQSCPWSTRFTADPRKLSWQDECLTLRSDQHADHGANMLYEFGVSADISTRHFGSITTLVSVIPRYLILNRTSYTVLLFEDSKRRNSSGGASRSNAGNAAHHILAKGDTYALYWVTGARSHLQASVLADLDYSWSDAFSIDHLTTTDLIIPPLHQQQSSSAKDSLCLQISIKRGSISQASIVVVITEIAVEDSCAIIGGSPLSSSGSIMASAEHVGWETFSFHSQIAGITVTIADKTTSTGTEGISKTKTSSFRNLFGTSQENINAGEKIARLTISRVSFETNVASHGTSAKLNVTGLKVEDLLPSSKYPLVLSSVERRRSDPFGTSEKYFLEVFYSEKPHAKYRWVEKLRVEMQDVKITTSMRFVDRLNGLVKETVAHFQNRSYSSFSEAASSILEDREANAHILEYFVTNSEEDDASMASLTGQKMYIESCDIAPVRAVVSFSREKGDVKNDPNAGFWLSNLKLKIENACLTLDAYKLSHAMATQEVLIESLSNFYVKSVKSQALGLIDSIQVTSLVTSMVTGGVTSLVSTIIGKTDPTLAASTSGQTFRYESLTNNQIVQKHSQLLQQCRSSTQFVEQVRHLVFDWDSNHTGLEARGCVVLGILNNSRHTLVLNAKLLDGAEIRVLPLGRTHAASVLDARSGSSEWRSDRSLVVFAWGYTPTLLTSGDVYFSVQSNACNVYVTRKTARLKANLGYTATFTHQETQNWWARHVVIVGDDLHASSVTNSSSTHSLTAGRSTSFSSRTSSLRDEEDPSTYALFGRSSSNAATTSEVVDDEYEVAFTSAALGIIAKQSGSLVIVRECTRLDSGESGAALATGRIAKGDIILAVNGMKVLNTTQFRDLVRNSPRPLVMRFRRSGERISAAYDLFGEQKTKKKEEDREGKRTEERYDLFGSMS